MKEDIKNFVQGFMKIFSNKDVTHLLLYQPISAKSDLYPGLNLQYQKELVFSPPYHQILIYK